MRYSLHVSNRQKMRIHYFGLTFVNCMCDVMLSTAREWPAVTQWSV